MAESSRKRLVGKVAIVSGSGRGIGRCEAMLLAQQGAKVVVNDIGKDPDGGRRANKVADEIRGSGEAAGSGGEESGRRWKEEKGGCEMTPFSEALEPRWRHPERSLRRISATAGSSPALCASSEDKSFLGIDRD